MSTLTLTLDDLPAEVLAWLAREAQHRNRTVAQQTVEVLRQAFGVPRQNYATRLEDFIAERGPQPETPRPDDPWENVRDPAPPRAADL